MSLILSLGLAWVFGLTGFLAGAWWASAHRKGRQMDERFPEPVTPLKVAGGRDRS